MYSSLKLSNSLRFYKVYVKYRNCETCEILRFAQVLSFIIGIIWTSFTLLLRKELRKLKRFINLICYIFSESFLEHHLHLQFGFCQRTCKLVQIFVMFVSFCQFKNLDGNILGADSYQHKSTQKTTKSNASEFCLTIKGNNVKWLFHITLHSWHGIQRTY